MKLSLSIVFCLFIALESHAANCSVTATGVNFGSYDVFQVAPTDSTGSVTVLCDVTTDVTVSIGPSSNSGGFIPRQMRHSALPDLLSYNLFADKQSATVWGDGTAGTSSITKKAPKNKPVSLTVYGRVPAGQDVAAGVYGEVLTVTILW